MNSAKNSSETSFEKKAKKTHFGYEQVSVEEKQGRVASVFNSVADKYDIMNDLMSFGVHRIWKRYTVELSGVCAGQRVLDLAGGTGDLAAKFTSLVGKDGLVVLADINEAMLRRGRERLTDKGIITNVKYVQADAQQLPFPDNYFDCISIAFGLRNVTNINSALESMQRILKPGGRLLILEFSKPMVPGLKTLYDFYSFKVLPAMGDLVANDSASYRYLAESIRVHPDQNTLLKMMQDSGLGRCEFYNLSGGIVALHRGYKQ